MQANLNNDSELGSPQADKRKQSFKNVTSNFDRLYNKRIDFDREAAKQMNVNDKVDYLDSQIKRRSNMVSLPTPDQINRNLQVIDMMRRDGDLPQPGRIYQKGVENSKNYTSSNN